LTYRARADVLWREVDGEAVLLDPKSGRYFGLEGAGSVLWRQLQSPSTFDDLRRAVREEFEAPAALAADLEGFLRSLCDAGLCDETSR
jgi:hypothetical protein